MEKSLNKLIEEILSELPVSICILNHGLSEENTDLTFSNVEFKKVFGQENDFKEIKKGFESIRIS